MKQSTFRYGSNAFSAEYQRALPAWVAPLAAVAAFVALMRELAK